MVCSSVLDGFEHVEIMRNIADRANKVCQGFSFTGLIAQGTSSCLCGVPLFRHQLFIVCVVVQPAICWGRGVFYHPANDISCITMPWSVGSQAYLLLPAFSPNNGPAPPAYSPFKKNAHSVFFYGAGSCPWDLLHTQLI